MWADFDFGDGHVITTGPKQPIRIGEKVHWDMFSRQGVHLLYNKRKLRDENESGQKDCAIEVSVKFVPQNGDITFKFSSVWH